MWFTAYAICKETSHSYIFGFLNVHKKVCVENLSLYSFLRTKGSISLQSLGNDTTQQSCRTKLSYETDFYTFPSLMSHEILYILASGYYLSL